MTFYEKVKQLCIKNGTTPSAVAKSIGCVPSVASTWRNIKGLPRPNTIKAVADYFGVPVEYFYPDEVTIQDNHGVIGDSNSNITINNGTSSLGEYERELLSVVECLDFRRKSLLLLKAYELKEGKD